MKDGEYVEAMRRHIQQTGLPWDRILILRLSESYIIHVYGCEDWMFAIRDVEMSLAWDRLQAAAEAANCSKLVSSGHGEDEKVRQLPPLVDISEAGPRHVPGEKNGLRLHLRGNITSAD